jgi:hypothetical protein
VNVTALIPYYGGNSAAAHSAAASRPAFLRSTVASLHPLATQVVVGALFGDTTVPEHPDITVLLLDCAPEYIPANLMRWAQLHASGDVIYATEADQILHYDPQILHLLTDDCYLVPHRLEQLGPREAGAERGHVVDYCGRRWVMPCGEPAASTVTYAPEGYIGRFGGGFLTQANLFRQAVFTDQPDLPVEHSMGLDMAGTALKTGSWDRFFVEHLSGYEHNERLARQ